MQMHNLQYQSKTNCAEFTIKNERFISFQTVSTVDSDGSGDEPTTFGGVDSEMDSGGANEGSGNDEEPMFESTSNTDLSSENDLRNNVRTFTLIRWRDSKP